jgi:hypothetical protein
LSNLFEASNIAKFILPHNMGTLYSIPALWKKSRPVVTEMKATMLKVSSRLFKKKKKTKNKNTET